MDIGEIIRGRRVALEMSQAELAGRLGISRNQVSNLENGKSYPSAKVLTALEEALETSFAQLLDGDRLSPLVWMVSAVETAAVDATDSGDVRVSTLQPGPGQRLLPLRVSLEPGAEWDVGEHLEPNGEHFVYVLQGDVEGFTGGRWFGLARRHAFYVHGEGPATWRNLGPEPAEILWIGGM